jgi:hypothetical protein
MRRYSLFVILALAVTCAFAADPPKTELKSDKLQLEVFHTDSEKGFYRGTRFDRSGVLGNVKFAGQTLFHPWKQKHNPENHDDIIGPVEEFGTLGYAEAKEGETFLKIGVGELEKPKEEKYRFTHPYKVVNAGERQMAADETSVRFKHTIATKSGYGYEYTKRVWIPENAPNVIMVLHSLKNTGTEPISTDVYNHNFFNVNNDPIGKNYEFSFRFKPILNEQKERAKELLKVEGTTLTFTGSLDKGSVYTEFGGLPTEPLKKDFKKDGYIPDFTMRHLKSKMTVKVWTDQPISKIRFWATTTTACPEPFLDVKVAPDKLFNWTWRYEFIDGE